ncbi:hypothetical protein HMPREF0758_4895 [Serratia odorifera DSM 4582]|uniref:Uncharacterized protein n=1 Tax=Serratia odorifera DSM 4582 TaxID=667129 RepID=D4E9P5_SEROD|nr:hypothetical protein HMPREF0758_4895 [Serratia odorifera DSM 4582]
MFDYACWLIAAVQPLTAFCVSVPDFFSGFRSQGVFLMLVTTASSVYNKRPAMALMHLFSLRTD